MAEVYLGLGTNLGDREGMLRAALSAIATWGRIGRCSSVYETEPWGDPDQPRYLNMCLRLETELEPEALHGVLKQAEKSLGRVPERHWGPRLIDIDLLTYDDLRINTPALTIPHPRIAERAFALAPLAEIAPTLTIAGLPGDVTRLRDSIPDWHTLVWPIHGSLKDAGTEGDAPAG